VSIKRLSESLVAVLSHAGGDDGSRGYTLPGVAVKGKGE